MISASPHRRFAAALVCAGLFLLSVGSAEAQQPSKEQIQTFEAHVKRGSELLEDEDYRDAIEQFEKARAVIDHPRIVFTIADAYRQWGRCDLAAGRYRDLLARDDTGDAIAKRVESELESLDSCVPKATLIVECEPGSARVTIDGQTYQCSEELDLELGEARITVDAPGFESEQRTVDITADEIVRERVTLAPSEHDDTAASTDWQTWAGFGSLGVGSALLAGGFFSDVGAVRRGQNILDAQDSGDTQRIAELEQEAHSARTRTAALYITGAVAIGAGVTLLTLESDSESQELSDGQATLKVRLRGLGISAGLRW